MTNIYINNGGRDPRFPHLMHFVLTVLTCGFWLPIWMLCWMFGR